LAKRKMMIPEYGTVMLNGIEYYRTRIEDADGKLVALYARTPEELYNKETNALEQINNATFHRKSPTVAEYCEKWLLMQSVHVRATTLTDYTSKVRRHIIAELGDKRMGEVSLDDIQLALVPVSKKSASVYKSVVILYKSIFRAAKESRIIDDNPTIYLTTKGGGVPQKDKAALTDDQAARLLDTVQGLPPYVFVMLGLYAGLRREEILALKWDAVYDKAYVLIDKFSEAFSLDHLLVQTPKKDDDAYRYYCKKEGSAETLVLKTGHDFPDNIVDGMPYDIFRKSVLNKIGNLRIYYQDKNSGRQTTAIDLPEYGSFHTYSDIKKREKDIIDYLVKYVLKIPDADLTLVKDTVKSIEGRLPNMEQLIDADEVHIGDQLYITLKPDTSVATLIDSNKVQFNNEVMTLNQWGCKVLGWSAVRIYVYTAIVGETETLQDKREKIVAGLKVKQ